MEQDGRSGLAVRADPGEPSPAGETLPVEQLTYMEKRERDWKAYAGEHGLDEGNRRAREVFNRMHYLAANRWIHGYFFKVLARINEETDIPMGTVLNWRRKNSHLRQDNLGRARELLVTRMRSTVGRPSKQDGYELHPHGIPEGYYPISFPDLALFTGADHSTLVNINKAVHTRRMGQRMKAEG